MADLGKNSPHTRPSRVGLKTVITYVEPELSDALRHLAIDLGRSMNDLGREAYSMLLAHYKDEIRKRSKKNLELLETGVITQKTSPSRGKKVN